MSNIEPDGPYVYQPYGTVTHPDRGRRLFAVGGIDADIKGVTREEAETIVRALRKLELESNSKEGL